MTSMFQLRLQRLPRRLDSSKAPTVTTVDNHIANEICHRASPTGGPHLQG